MRRLLLPLFLAVAVVLAACSGDSKPSPYAAKASQLVDDLAAGNFDAVTKQFSADVAAHLSAGELAVDWRSIQRDTGIYQSKGTPETHSKSGHTTEIVPLRMEGGRKAIVQVTYNDADGTIAGLYFADPDKKAPATVTTVR